MKLLSFYGTQFRNECIISHSPENYDSRDREEAAQDEEKTWHDVKGGSIGGAVHGPVD